MQKTPIAHSFRLQEINPQDFRRQTRNASIRIMLVFAASAMLLSAGLVSWLGAAGDSNFKWNLTGVILGLLFTSALVAGLFHKQQWMAASVYGWRLKRCLMRITNQMHHLKKAVEQEDTQAMQILSFYHLALYHMHQLDGNASAASELVHEMNTHRDAMTKLQLPLEQHELKSEWLPHIKALSQQSKNDRST